MSITLKHLPFDMIDMIFDIEEKDVKLDNIERYSKSNYNFIVHRLNNQFENMIEEYEDEVKDISDLNIKKILKDYEYIDDDSMKIDTKFKFDDVISYFSNEDLIDYFY